MVERIDRPIVPQTHANEVEHRKMLAVRANASFPKDGTEAMTAPLRLMQYAAAELPDATLHEGSEVWISDEGVFAVSDGTDWVRLEAAPEAITFPWVDARDYGVFSGTEFASQYQTAELQAAIDAAIALAASSYGNRAKLVLPQGVIEIDGTITIDTNLAVIVEIEGQGQKATQIYRYSNSFGDTFLINDCAGCSLRGIGFRGPFTDTTSGTNLHFTGNNFEYILDDIYMAEAFTGIYVDGAMTDAHWSHIKITSGLYLTEYQTLSAGIRIDNSVGGIFMEDVSIDADNYDYGVLVQNIDGLMVTNLNIYGGKHQFAIIPSTAVQNVRVINLWLDGTGHALTVGLHVQSDGSNNIQDVHFVGGAIHGGTTANAAVKLSASDLSVFSLTGMHIRHTAAQPVEIDSGTKIALTGNIIQTALAVGGAGVAVNAAATDVSVEANLITGYATSAVSGITLTDAKRVLLETINTTSGTSIVFDNVPAFPTYQFIGGGISCDTASRELWLQVSNNNGSTWQTTAGHYIGYALSAAGVLAMLSSSQTLIKSDATNTAAQSNTIAIIIDWLGGVQPTARGHIETSAVGRYFQTTRFAGNDSVVNAFRFVWSGSGNFDAGSIALYGIR